jgi:hypothetical protein
MPVASIQRVGVRCRGCFVVVQTCNREAYLTEYSVSSGGGNLSDCVDGAFRFGGKKPGPSINRSTAGSVSHPKRKIPRNSKTSDRMSNFMTRKIYSDLIFSIHSDCSNSIQRRRETAQAGNVAGYLPVCVLSPGVQQISGKFFRPEHVPALHQSENRSPGPIY